jgi:hypothetical protein
MFGLYSTVTLTITIIIVVDWRIGWCSGWCVAWCGNFCASLCHSYACDLHDVAFFHSGALVLQCTRYWCFHSYRLVHSCRLMHSYGLVHSCWLLQFHLLRHSWGLTWVVHHDAWWIFFPFLCIMEDFFRVCTIFVGGVLMSCGIVTTPAMSSGVWAASLSLMSAILLPLR